MLQGNPGVPYLGFSQVTAYATTQRAYWGASRAVTPMKLGLLGVPPSEANAHIIGPFQPFLLCPIHPQVLDQGGAGLCFSRDPY